MNKFSILLIFSMLVSLFIVGQTKKPAYTLFDKSGHNTDFYNMITDLSTADVIFIGEYHNNPISHWMEYEITKALYDKQKGKIILGAEMFEADEQLILSEYVQGIISSSRFERDCRLWDNYGTDYEPLVDFARAHKLPFIATNIPRRYADILHKKGNISVLDSLNPEAKKYIAPLPIPFKPDSTLLSEIGMMSMMSKNPLALAKAQAIKDATMAYFINKNFKKNFLFIHYNGSYHSDNFDGIIYYLKKYNSGLKIKTITTIQQDDLKELDKDNRNMADYVIAVSSNMTRTY